MIHDDHYRDLEHGLWELLTSLNRTFSLSEAREVRDFIEAREYGLALETIAGILVEEKYLIPAEVAGEIKRLADSMNIVDDQGINYIIGTAGRELRRHL